MKIYLPMMNRDIQELVIGIGLVVLLVIAINPFHIFMPTPLMMTVVVGAAILALLFVSFIWREKTQDEREEYHRLLASRTAYLSGAAVLLVAMIVQVATTGHIDGWLAVSLGVMVIAKLGAHIYSRAKK